MLAGILRALGFGPRPSDAGGPPDAPGLRIIVGLPLARDRPGTLTALDRFGQIASGPWPVAGHADGKVAAALGNPDRDRLQPGGDIPNGSYEVTARRLPDGSQQEILVLTPWSGDAAAARGPIELTGGHAYMSGADGSLVVPFEAMTELLGLVPATPAELDQAIQVTVQDLPDCDEWRNAEPTSGSVARRRWYPTSGHVRFRDEGGSDILPERDWSDQRAGSGDGAGGLLDTDLAAADALDAAGFNVFPADIPESGIPDLGPASGAYDQ